MSHSVTLLASFFGILTIYNNSCLVVARYVPQATGVSLAMLSGQSTTSQRDRTGTKALFPPAVGLIMIRITMIRLC